MYRMDCKQNQGLQRESKQSELHILPFCMMLPSDLSTTCSACYLNLNGIDFKMSAPHLQVKLERLVLPLGEKKRVEFASLQLTFSRIVCEDKGCVVEVLSNYAIMSAS